LKERILKKEILKKEILGVKGKAESNFLERLCCGQCGGV
jgi:hypothetical protein